MDDDEEEKVERHFLDIISDKMRTKMSSRGMICEEAWKKSVLGKMMPPEEIKKRLSPLCGLCTHNLLDNIRYGFEYEPIDWCPDPLSDSVQDWFTDLQNTTTEWNYKLVFQGECEQNKWGQHQSTEDQLLALDRAIQVPNDAPETTAIALAVKSIPDWVVGKVKEHIPGVDIEIFPMGSFPCNTKVIDIDEFDFLLICDSSSEFLDFIIYRIIRAEINYLDHESKTSVILNWNSGLPNCNEPHITRVYKHGPAICVELAWLCKKQHNHVLSVDMTLARRDNTKTLKSHCGRLQNSKVFKDFYETIDEEEKAVAIPDDFTTCVLDQKMCQHLLTISENIPAAYRLLKVFSQHLLPKSIYTDYSVIGCIMPPCVSSHKLKQVLLHHVEQHPSGEEWSSGQFTVRLSEMLRAIQVGNTEEEFIVTEGYTNIGREKVQQKSEIKSNIFAKTMGVYKHNLHFMASALEAENQDAASFDEQKGGSQNLLSAGSMEYCETLFPDNIKLLFKQQNDRNLYPCNLDPYKLNDIATCSNALVYNLALPDMVYAAHPIIRTCHRFIRNQYKENQGADLSKIERADFAEVWLLYQSKLLKACDLRNEEVYCHYVTILKNLYKLFGGRCPVLEACQHALDQIGIVDSVVSTYPDDYWDPIPVIPECLPLLNARERAIVKGISYRVITQAYDLSGLEISKYSCLSIHFQKIMIALQYMWGIQLRYSEDKGGQAGEVVTVDCDFLVSRTKISKYYAFPLTYFLIRNYIGSDPHYLCCIKPGHTVWADWFLNNIIHTNMNCVQYSTEHAETSFCESNKSDFEIIRIEYDFQGKMCLFRSVASYGLKQLREVKRAPSGMHLTFVDEILESKAANKIATAVKATLNTVGAIPRQSLDKLSIAPYRPMTPRIQSLLCRGVHASLHDLAAVAFLAKRQIHIYEDRCRNFVKTATIPHGIFCCQTPISLLYSPGTQGLPGHFDLLIPRRHHLGTDDLWLIEENKDIFASSTSLHKPDPEPSFHSILVSGVMELPMTKWRVVKVVEDENCLLRCVASSLIQSLLMAPRQMHGSLINNKAQALENSAVDRIRIELAEVYLREDAAAEQDLCDIPSKEEKDNGAHVSLAERLSETTALSPKYYAGYFQLVALAYLVKLQIQIFEKKHGCWIQTASVPNDMFNNRKPISLLFTPADEDQFGKYDLLVPIDGLMLKDTWNYDTATSPFTSQVDAGGDEQLSFAQVLDPNRVSNAIDHSFHVIRTYPSGQSLFQCIAVHMIKGLQSAPRTYNGTPADIELASIESVRASRIRATVAGFLETEMENLIDKTDEWPVLLAATSQKTYSSLSDRIRAMSSATEPVGYLELAAVSFLTKTQIHVYEDKCGGYVLLAKVGQGLFLRKTPISILYIPAKNGQPWNFQYMLLEPQGEERVPEHVIVDRYTLNDQNESGELKFIHILDPSVSQIWFDAINEQEEQDAQTSSEIDSESMDDVHETADDAIGGSAASSDYGEEQADDDDELITVMRLLQL